MSVSYYAGLDLGQMRDYSALVVVEAAPATDPVTLAPAVDLGVRHLHRWPLGTPYPRIVDDVRGLYAAGPLADSTLVVDETGVGRPVVEMFRAADIRAHLAAYAITAGLRPGDGTVPKKDLVGAVEAALGAGRLRFAEALPLTPTLVKELKAFQVRVSPDRNETFAAWRERDHDDLVLALALAVWVATRGGGSAGCYAYPSAEEVAAARSPYLDA